MLPDFLARGLGLEFIFLACAISMILFDLLVLLSLPSGCSFTWTSDWQPPTSAKLNKFLLSLKWKEQYPRSSARALPRILSDHILILLDTGDLFQRHSIFRFENMWMSHDHFDSNVRQFWSFLDITCVDPGGRLVLKLWSLRSYLKSWSRHNFHHVLTSKRQLLSSIHVLQTINDSRRLL